MNASDIGSLIASLRRERGMTQLEFAQKLNISDKTVSRWESGKGFPEITQIPAIARLFGITIDYLMTGARKGISFAGNILADVVKTVDYYPEEGTTAHILNVSRAVGGSVPNTAIDLAKIDRSMPVSAIGRIGDDEYGQFVLSRMRRYGIDCERVTVSGTQPTSFSDIISRPDGERTIFHSKGANAEFSPSNVDISSLDCRILHIGYILLLDEFDRADSEYGTVMARFLHEIQMAGIQTSIDIVTDTQANYKEKLLPALRYCDYVIINEVEASLLTGLAPYRSDGRLDLVHIRETMRYMAENGVREKIVIHCKRAGFCYDVKSDSFTVIPSLLIPKENIKGSVGAGDAYCAGILYGLYHHYDDKKLLEFASAAAASNLFSENSVDGMRSYEEILHMLDTYERAILDE